MCFNFFFFPLKFIISPTTLQRSFGPIPEIYRGLPGGQRPHFI